MARMIPSLSDEKIGQIRSRAEARVYVACRDQLPNDAVVIYSATWLYRTNKDRIEEGEADFTVLFPQTGIFVVEVKGGGISFDASTGQWQSQDQFKKINDIKDPFKQASDERHAILNQLTGHPIWRQWPGKRLTLGHAVMFPDVVDATPFFGPNRQRDFIGVNNDVNNLVRWFGYVQSFWTQKNEDALGNKGIQLIEEILCKSIEVRAVLKSTLDDVEQQRIELTMNQAKILRSIGGRKRAVISGGAGTGKTVLAAEKARQLARTGKSVLLLCYNRPLADALAQGLAEEKNIQVFSFHQLCDRRIRVAQQTGKGDLLKEAAEAYPGDSNQILFDAQMPYALILSVDVLDEKYDAIVVDEAQDFSDEYWMGVEMLLSDEKEGHLYIFIDENQALYPRRGDLPVKDDQFYLTTNCRNTAPIHLAGYAYYDGEPVDVPKLAGPDVARVSAENNNAQADAVMRTVRHWINVEGIPPEDVVVLLAKKPKAQLEYLLEQHASGISLAIETRERKKSVLVDTVARFKGLEAQAIVLWLGDDILDEKQWEMVYVGVTRAKSLLTIVGTKKMLGSLNKAPLV